MNRIWRRYKPFISTGIQGLITYRVDFILCVGSLVLSFHLLLQLIIPLLTSYKIEMSILILVGLS